MATDRSLIESAFNKDRKGETSGLWRCLHRLYNFMLALPVLGLLGAVVFLSGNFGDEVMQTSQKVSDLKGATNILNVTKHLSEEAALNGVFWAYQSEEAREELHNHVTVTDQFLAGFVSWSPTPCAEYLGPTGESSASPGPLRRFITARAGIEYNDAPPLIEREYFYDFVEYIAVCSLVDIYGDVFRVDLRSEIVFYHLLAASVFVQDTVVRTALQCRLSPGNVSVGSLQLRKASAYARVASFVQTKGRSWNSFPHLDSLHNVDSNGDVCSNYSLNSLRDGLHDLTAHTEKALEVCTSDAAKFKQRSIMDLCSRSLLVLGTVVALSAAIYIFRSDSQLGRKLSQGGGAMGLSLTCVTNCSSPPIIAHDKVLAAVLAVKLPGLGHVMQGDDASAALAVMTSILTFVEERAHKHQAFVLQQQGAACVLAAVSCDSSFSWWPVYRIADLALDLMTSFLDIEICMTPDPDRSHEALTFLLAHDHYTCVEVEEETEEGCESRLAYYLTGKVAFFDDDTVRIPATLPAPARTDRQHSKITADQPSTHDC
ncbi:hypothetical protein BaRGS_00023858 [Batillaria attramentaria]|uniref:Uncharacterized protein n=1 Tax=Batillaria attramentaria TaxID=370345 RepID=A0ABD0KCX4_9CAEN